MILALLLLLLSSAVEGSVIGLDVSQPLSRTVADCFVKNNYKYVIIRAWYCGSGTPDSNAVTSYNNLRAAGMPHIGFYLFPCVGRSACPSAANQVAGVKKLITDNKMQADSVWLDIEGGGSCTWSSDFNVNKQFYQDLLGAAKQAWPDRYGVYSSRYMWQTLFGSQSWINPGDDKVKLWYAHYDNVENFSTFLTFSSWPTKTSPYAKQYLGNANVCNFNVDLNVAPEFFGIGAGPTPVGATPSPPAPPAILSCSFQNVKGVCSTTNNCAQPKQWVASADGATGCQTLPIEWKCCVAAAGATGQTPCSYNNIDGTCIATDTCIASKKQSVPSANGARGCEALPTDVRCCIDPAAQSSPATQSPAISQPNFTPAPNGGPVANPTSNNNGGNNGGNNNGGQATPGDNGGQPTAGQPSPSLMVVVDSTVKAGAERVTALPALIGGALLVQAAML